MKYKIGDIIPFEQTQEATDWVNSVEGNYYLEDYAPDENGNMQLVVRQLTPHVPTEEEIQAKLTQVVQNALDNFAKTRNYDGILSVCSYANSTNPKFKAEADYCVQLRDDTWAAGYIILDQVKSGFRAIPTAEELIALLPVSSAKWPDEQ